MKYLFIADDIRNEYNNNMGFSLLIPAILGIFFAFLINYFADILPISFKLTRPVCPIEGCKKPFSWSGYIFLLRCDNCLSRSRARPIAVYFLSLAASIFLWTNHPPSLVYFLSILSLSYLVVVGLIDLENHLILLPLNIAGVVILGGVGFILHGWLSTLIGGIAGAGIMYLFYLFGKVFTRLRAKKLNVAPGSLEDSLAFGDVILLALLGFLLGWPTIWFGLLLGLLLAGLLSILVILALALRNKYKQQALSVFIPLGPGFIIAAITIVYFPKFIFFF